jgi:hypothetical protein
VYGRVTPLRSAPLALRDVEIGAAQPGATDVYKNVVRALNAGLVDLLHSRAVEVPVQTNRPHRAPPYPMFGESATTPDVN